MLAVTGARRTPTFRYRGGSHQTSHTCEDVVEEWVQVNAILPLPAPIMELRRPASLRPRFLNRELREGHDSHNECQGSTRKTQPNLSLYLLPRGASRSLHCFSLRPVFKDQPLRRVRISPIRFLARRLGLLRNRQLCQRRAHPRRSHSRGLCPARRLPRRERPPRSKLHHLRRLSQTLASNLGHQSRRTARNRRQVSLRRNGPFRF